MTIHRDNKIDRGRHKKRDRQRCTDNKKDKVVDKDMQDRQTKNLPQTLLAGLILVLLTNLLVLARRH